MFTLRDTPLESLAVTTTAVEEEFVTCVAECDDPQLTPIISNTKVKVPTNIHRLAFFSFRLSQHKNAAGSTTANKEYSGPPVGNWGLGMAVAVAAPAVIVICVISGLLLPSSVRLGGLKLQLVEAGSPLQLNVWVPVKPAAGIIVRPTTALCPCATVSAVGLAVNEKSGDAGEVLTTMVAFGGELSPHSRGSSCTVPQSSPGRPW